MPIKVANHISQSKWAFYSNNKGLRKQARQLENEIDSKLVAFSKLCSNYTTSMLTSRPTSSSGQQQQQNGASSGANSSSSDLMFMTLSNELEEAIKKLTNINTKMGESLNMAENASINSNATIHTLQVISCFEKKKS